MPAGTKPPPFFCPLCRRKHRADLTPLEKNPTAQLRTRCQGCRAELAVRLEDGAPVVEVTADPPTPAAPAAAAAAVGGPYEGPEDLEPGHHAGRYEVEAMLGRGHTATIYRALDPETKRTVALKVLGPDADAGTRQRFDRQIEVQGRIRHPNVLPVYDRGALPDGRSYFAAELLHEPRTLATLVERARADGAAGAGVADLVRDVLLPIADGIYVANIENGQIHRDLLPENVLVDGRTGRPYVTDFSHAAPPSPDGKAAPVPLSHYVAPETTLHRVHARTDVWGLGALLHLILSGEPPLAGRGRALLEAARKGRVRDLPADAPPALAAIARKAMAPDPDHRYVNARQMAADLRAWLQGGTVRAVEEFGGQAAHRIELKEALARGGRLALWVLGGLLVGLLLGSRIRPGGGDGASLAVAAAAREAERIDREVTGLGPRVARLTPPEAGRTWAAIVDRLDALEQRVDGESEGAANVLARTRHTRQRLLVPSLAVAIPGGAELEAHNTTLDRTFVLGPGGRSDTLAPGRYEIASADGALRFPLRLDLDVAPQGVAREAPSIRVEIPGEALLPPDGTTFVPTGTLPAAADGETVRGFFVDRAPVSVAAWRAFLEAQGETPPETDAAGPAHVRAEQAAAYCAWRAEQEGRPVRLPTEAEWMLAAGATLLDGPLSPPPQPPAHGLGGLGPASPEFATGAGGAWVLKGGNADDVGSGWVFDAAPVGDDTTAAFRCVRPLR